MKSFLCIILGMILLSGLIGIESSATIITGHEGPTEVKSKSYMETWFTVSDNGLLEATTRTWSRKKLAGFTVGGVFISLLDSSKKPIWTSTLQRYGVNGRSEWKEKWTEQVPLSLISQVSYYCIVHQHTPTNRFWEWIDKNIVPLPTPKPTPEPGKVLCSTLAPNCGKMSHKYRTIDGTCNNMKYSLRGSRNQSLARFVKANYARSNLANPNVRHLSQSLMTDKIVSDNRITILLVFWGQFVAHDITLVVGVAQKHECYKVSKESDSCFNIQIPKGDKFFPFMSQMQMAKSPECDNRNQVMNTTAYLDGSQIYGGYDSKVAVQVRMFRDGLLLEHPAIRTPNKNLGFLPSGKDEYSHLGGCGPDSKLLVGDPRGDENFMLTSLHTLFLRQHNAIARKLRQFRPVDSDEKIFQEARKIVIGIFQRITYEEWLPKVIGEGILSEYRGYSEEVDPTMHNGAATAALRFGHAFIPLELRRHDPQGRFITSIPLNETFCVPNKLYSRENVLMLDEILRGAMGPYKGNDHQVSLNDHLTHNLFPKVQELNLDLAALNIQRGRAHGLGSYGDYRKFCNLPKLNDWFDFVEVIRGFDVSKTKMLKLMNYYNPNDMDIWLAGMLEKPMNGAILGGTFVCLLKKQFESIRDGDRFWYENNQFTNEQLNTIKGYTAGRLICDNLDSFSNLRSHSFVHTDDFVKCSTLPALNLDLWK